MGSNGPPMHGTFFWVVWFGLVWIQFMVKWAVHLRLSRSGENRSLIPSLESFLGWIQSHRTERGLNGLTFNQFRLQVDGHSRFFMSCTRVPGWWTQVVFMSENYPFCQLKLDWFHDKEYPQIWLERVRKSSQKNMQWNYFFSYCCVAICCKYLLH